MKATRNPLFPTRLIRLQFSALPALAFAATLVLGASNAEAQLTWNSGGPTNNWSTAGGNENWNPGGVVWSQNQDAIFDLSFGPAESINVTTANTFNDITFATTGYTIASAGAGSLTLSNDGNSTITVTNLADTATLNETLADNNGVPSTLTKAGAGTLELFGTANNTFTGGTVISAGTLTASHEGALGAAAVTNNSVLNINKAGVTFIGLSVGMSGNGISNVTALGTGTGTVALNGNYSGFTGDWNIGVGAAAGAGKVQMNGADNADTTITILPNATVFSSAGTHNAAVVLKGGDTGESIGQLRVDGATTNWAGPITLDGTITGANDGFIGSSAGTATISGLISEAGGARVLSKAGGGAVVLTNSNTYSGGTEIVGGRLSVGSILNSGVNAPLGSGSTITLGSLGSTGILLYTGAGETTNRVINLGGVTGNGQIEASGPSGLLKFTSNLTATGAGPKSLILAGSTAATGEFAGQIVDNTGSNATTLSTAFVAAANTITLSSVRGITTGTPISGTGIAGGTTITAIDPVTRIVTLSAPTSGAGTAGQTISVAGVVNSTNLSKSSGSGLWTLSGNNTFTGNAEVRTGDLVITNSNALGVGPKTVTIVPTSNPTSLSSLVLDGSGGDITLASNLGFTTSFDALSGSLLLPIPGEGAIINQSGNNTIAGNFNLTSGGGGTTFLVNSGSLTLSGGLGSSSSGRTIYLRGNSNGFINGIIGNGTGTVAVVKDAGSGTWTLSGTNTYTGATTVNSGELILAGTSSNASARTVNGGVLTISGDYSGASGTTTATAGTLRLDYSSVNSGKIGNASILTLAGGSVELAGGSHAEDVASTTLAAGSQSLITHSSGSATLNLKTVTGSGFVTLAETGIATTNNLNANGILPWARVLVGGTPVLASNSTNAADGPIVPYTGFSDVTRLGASALPNSATANVRIINGGTAGNITLTGAPTNQINFLQMFATDGSATIGPAAPTDVLSIGIDGGGSIWQSAGAGSLSIGTAANDGILTTGDVANATPALLSLTNDSSNPLVVNSTITNNGTDVVSLFLSGSGPIALNGNITSSGTITTGGSTPVTIDGNITAATTIAHNSSGLLTVSGDISGAANVTAGGNLLLSGDNSFSGALTITGTGRTVTLTGNNSARPGTATGRTVVSGGNILRLEANTGNTTGPLSTVLSAEPVSPAQPLVLNSLSTLQLRSDSSVTFAGTENVGGINGGSTGMSTTVDVDRLNAPATGQTLTLSPLFVPYGNTVSLNVTGANGYGLSIGRIRNVTGTASAITLNPTTANLTVAGYENQFSGAANTNNSTLTLSGTSAGNVVSGIIRNQGPGSVGTGIVSLTKSGTSTWTLDGANTYTGTTTISEGVLKAGSSGAFNNTGTLTMSGTGTLDLNGFDATFTAQSAGLAANLITDTKSGTGTSTLRFLQTNNTAVATAIRIADGPSRVVAVRLTNANGQGSFTNPASTYSGGTTLMHHASGTRLVPSTIPAITGTPGAIVSGPYGTGPIVVGEAATDKAGIFIQTSGQTLANEVVSNTNLGTDRVGTFRLDAINLVFAGQLTAGLAPMTFSTNGTGSATVTGKVTGTNGLTLLSHNAGGTALTITLANTGSTNDYEGDTVINQNPFATRSYTLALGAANQIPNGTGKGNVTVNTATTGLGTLNLAGFAETINGLSGNGTVTSTSGSPILTVGDNNAAGTFSGTTAGSLSLVKTGSGVQTLSGVIGHSGDTTVAAGTLSVTAPSTFANGADVRLNTGGTLNLASAGTDVVDQLFINGIAQNAGKWGRIGSIAALGADFETNLITGDGLLSVSTAGGTPFSLWAAAEGLDGTPGKENGPNDDPDSDGASNLEEFAFDGDPLNGAVPGKVIGKIGEVAGSDYMTITLPVRNGGSFSDASGPEVSATVDGVIYHVEGSDALTAWTLNVTEVTGPDATAIQTGLDPVSTGWTYRTFRAPNPVSSGNPTDFLRAGAE